MRKPAFCICEKQRHRSAVLSRRHIKAFVFYCLDGIIPLNFMSFTSPMAHITQSGFYWTWSETSKTGFLVMRLIYINYTCAHSR